MEQEVIVAADESADDGETAAAAGLLHRHRTPGRRGSERQQRRSSSQKKRQQAKKLAPRETVHVLVSDHGSHMGPFYEYSAAGQVEHRLPALFLLVPNSLLLRRPDVRAALEHNQHALVTPLDLHRTIKHLAVLEQGDEAQEPPSAAPAAAAPVSDQKGRSEGGQGESVEGEGEGAGEGGAESVDPVAAAANRGVPGAADPFYTLHSRSMLRPIAYSRSCDDALIPAKLCACSNNNNKQQQ